MYRSRKSPRNMINNSDFVLLIALAIITYLASYSRQRAKDGFKKIPQPIRLPFIGKLLQIRQPNPWIQMAKWSNQFGPIYRLKIGHSNLIIYSWLTYLVFNSFSGIGITQSSNRIIRTKVIKIFIKTSLTFMPYDDLWRRERKLLHLLTQPKAASSYEPIQSQESAQLCLDILNDPSKHWGHSQRLFSSIEHLIFEHLIDLLPFLHHLPEILSPWKQYGCQVSDETLDLFGGLYRQVSGLAHSEQLPNHDHSAACFIARIEILIHFLLEYVPFGAGSDTTADAIETFIFACAANPDKVAKAHEELDRVIGRERLPEFSEQESLVYCTAMVRELLRWRTVIAGGLAHMTTEDDEYEGYFIPKGTAIVANHWAIHLDEATYKDAHKFIPERFIDPHTGSLIGTKWSASGHHAFGFGRRIFPGLHIANKSLFITFTRLLWSFDIRIKTASSMSTEGLIDAVKFSPGFSSHPMNLDDTMIEIVARDLTPEPHWPKPSRLPACILSSYDLRDFPLLLWWKCNNWSSGSVALRTCKKSLHKYSEQKIGCFNHGGRGSSGKNTNQSCGDNWWTVIWSVDHNI
ncbi:uncharacterized protein VP01_1686g2 [Puccinia sorghi]|uniref:Cytochrome P450 n=1 Tax=Puccinia sorghi TaxID=27349 RepID=A0A0L6VFU0_9BASI|nr:uncharacterized protein VP01_1686g2 [Puccinia sorghi]